MNEPMTVMNMDMEKRKPDTKTKDAMWHFFRKPYQYPTICPAGQQSAEKGAQYKNESKTEKEAV